MVEAIDQVVGDGVEAVDQVVGDGFEVIVAGHVVAGGFD